MNAALKRLRLWQIGLAAVLVGGAAWAQPGPADAVAYFDFGKGAADLTPAGRLLELHGARWVKVEDPMQPRLGWALEFKNAGQYAQFAMSRALDGVAAATVGGWFYTRRWGEQSFVSRGLPEIAPAGERMFRRESEWVNFTLGTDQHGFFLGTVNGNGNMPFPFVTINEVPINTWNQLVVVKTADGYQKFYQNGALVHSDHEAAAAPRIWPFRDVAQGEPVRLSIPHGGLIGEVWIYGRELDAGEISKDFQAKRGRYHPALPGERVMLREMDERPSAGLWKEPVTAANWQVMRDRILQGVFKVFGAFPSEKIPLDPKIISEEDCGSYLRRKVTIQVQPGDRMPAYVLIPKNRTGRLPAILCIYGTTSGAGKETTVGLSGPRPGTPPARNRDFAVTMAKAGFVAFAADYLRDGERIRPGRPPYDTTDFYREFPNWSIHGKDVWDNMRAIDYLQSLDFVDPDKIGMVGHSYGGHSTIFAAALEPRIKVAVSNGPVSDLSITACTGVFRWGRATASLCRQ
jgi:hypothetical protein